MVNPINIELLDKLRKKEPLTEEDLVLILENEEFLNMLLTWLHWNDEKNGFEIGYYGDSFIDKEETNECIHDYLDKRGIM